MYEKGSSHEILYRYRLRERHRKVAGEKIDDDGRRRTFGLTAGGRRPRVPRGK
jgi:hypothetical protein